MRYAPYLLKAASAWALLVLATASTATAQNQNADELLQLAVEKGQAGDYNYAAALLEKSLALDSTRVHAWTAYGQVLEEQRDLNGAAAAFKRAIALDSTNAFLHNRLALLFQTFGLRDYALLAYEDALRLAPSDTVRATMLMNRATAHLKTQDWDLAMRDNEAALALMPDHPDVLNNVAMVYMRLGRDAEAIGLLKRLARNRQAPRFVYSNMALVYTRMDSLERALTYFDTAYTFLDTTAAGAEMGLHYSNYGEAQYRLGRHRAAQRSLDLSARYYPANSYVYRTQGLNYLAMGLTREACRALDHAAELGFTESYGPEVDALRAEHCGGADASRGR